MREIWFIRHGESLWNAEGRWQGQTLAPLAVGRRVLLAASDLVRAVETAEIVAGVLGLAVRVDARLRELDVGAWSGHTPAEVERRWPADLARFRSGDAAFAPGGGESRLALRARVGAALAALEAIGADAIALVSHLGVVRAFRPGTQLAPGTWLKLDSLAEPAPPGHNPTPEPAAL